MVRVSTAILCRFLVDQCTQHSIDRAQCAAECSFTAVTMGIHTVMVTRFEAARTSKNGPNKGHGALIDARDTIRPDTTRLACRGAHFKSMLAITIVI